MGCSACVLGECQSAGQEADARIVRDGRARDDTTAPAARVNTLLMMRALRAAGSEELQALAQRLRQHGAKSDLI